MALPQVISSHLPLSPHLASVPTLRRVKGIIHPNHLECYRVGDLERCRAAGGQK